ncbi:MAG: TolC family protein [Bacteroidales bacterium]|nr:TolC family protein [Bacteroidales bacterium]
MNRIFYILIFISVCNPVFSQSIILDEYVKQGLENNLALKQQDIDFQQSLYAIKEARAYFFPQLSLNARATFANGGRTIDFPIGDLLNPVYSTLNTLTASNSFPQVENEQIQFLRPFEHETKLSLIQPVFNPAIYYNTKIQQEFANSKSINKNIYQRNLVAEIQTAYLNYLKANKGIELITETRTLVLENIRVNESLFANDKITIDNVYRSKAELSKLDQKMAEAEKMLSISAKYFNFLLNRDLNEQIIIDETLGEELPTIPVLSAPDELASGRSELKIINSYANANNLSQKMYGSDYLPTVLLAADYGFQGDAYKFTADDDFAMLSFVLKWDLFTGNKRKAKLQQAKLQGESLSLRYQEIQNQLEIQINTAYLDLLTSEKAIEAARELQNSAEKTFFLINKMYKEGQANLLKYLDAQTTLTNARENYWIEVYDYYMKLAEYQKQTEVNL